jgi:hypothetical protein
VTDEERQRQMDFIVNTLAQVSVRLDGITIKVDGLTDSQSKTEEERRADEIRIARLEEAYATMTRLAERFYERLDNNRMRVEESFVTLTRLAERYDGRYDGKR